MYMKRKRKWILSLAVTCAMLFSSMGTAAAEPMSQSTWSAITADAEPDLESGATAEEPEKETEEESTEETEEESREESEEESTEETEESMEEPEEESTDGFETETGTAAETEEESESRVEEETPEESREETTEESKPTVNLTPDVHEHIWSANWTYDGISHWHECNREGCPVTDDSGKDGYGDHSYDDYGVCRDCGYDAMDGIAAASAVPSYEDAYTIMTGLKDSYPEGMRWNNYEPYGSKGELGSAYTWNGGAVYGARSAVGCMAFAFILSDEVFGNLPARAIERGKFTFEDVKVGDILRINGNSHSVIVLRKAAGGVIVAEANYNNSVHWGRSLSEAEVKRADFIITRYPKDYVPVDDSDADTVMEEGTAGSLNWSVTRGRVLTIWGRGAIPNYSQNDQPWSSSYFDTVVIEDGVTSIGDSAFSGCGNLLNVYIPDSVTAIGRNAFKESSLVEVTIPGSVQTIGDGGFYGCANLTSATVSEGVETIGNFAFHGCTSLAYIDFPASIQSVGAGAFEGCTSMVRVRFKPGSNKVTLGSGLFRQCQKLLHVTLPQTIDSISDNMFASCTSLPRLYIPASVQNIGELAFTSCKGLKVVSFGGSEAEWKNITNIVHLNSILSSVNAKVEFNVVFDDPFATSPDDPGDFHPDDSGSCTNHVDTDKDGKCDYCGEVMSAGTPGTGDGGSNDPSTGGSSGDSGSSSDGSSNSSSGESGGDRHSGEFYNPAISTVVKRGADGSGIITKTHRDGTVVTITTDAAGKVAREARLSDLGIQTAEQNGKAVLLPFSPVLAAKDVSKAWSITVHTQKDHPVRVAVPVFLPAAGTVAFMVNADGSARLIKGSLSGKSHVVVLLPHGATIKIADNSRSFSDVPAGSRFEEAVSFISARELFYGTTETAFAPESPMTYAMAATALARFDGVETDGGRTWYEKGMEWAGARGMQNGSDPNGGITCEQLVIMLWKYQGSPMEADGLSGGTDASQISDVQKAMDWALKNGIVNGFEDGNPAPQMRLNRAQAAQIIMNFGKITALTFIP